MGRPVEIWVEEWLKINGPSLRCKPRTQWEGFRRIEETIEKGGIEWGTTPPFRQWEIYYGKLSPSSKRRPYLIVQNNFLNRAVQRGNLPSVVVVPLSGRLRGGDFRLTVPPRDRLPKRSEAVFTALGVIPATALHWEEGALTRLTPDEIEEATSILAKLFDFPFSREKEEMEREGMGD